MPSSTFNDRIRPPHTPYPYEPVCAEHVDCSASRPDGDFESAYVPTAEAFPFGNDFVWHEASKNTVEELCAVPHSASRVANRAENISADTTTNTRTLGSPFVAHKDEKPQPSQEPHIQWASLGKRPRSGDQLINERPAKRPRPLAFSTEASPHAYQWIPKTPICPTRHFHDIVGQQQSVNGTMYKVVWRNSWVLESDLPDVTPILQNHIKQWGKPWDGYSQYHKQ